MIRHTLTNIGRSETDLNSRFFGLDHLRTLAIMLVLMCHYTVFFQHPDWWPTFALFGWSGVDLFFVLSGFLVSSQLFSLINAGKTISFSVFFLKRFFRIIPLFLVVVAIYYSFPFFREKGDLPPLYRLLTFTQNFGLNVTEFSSFSHAWSLSVEEHFYLLLPLILILLTSLGWFRRSYYLIIMLFSAGFLIRAYLWNDQFSSNSDSSATLNLWTEYIYFPTYNRLDGLLVGVSIASIYHFRPDLWAKITRYGNLIMLIGLLILIGAYYIALDTTSFYMTVFGFPLIALGYGMLVVAAISPSCFLFRWNSGSSTFIATLSYGIYLSHKGVIHVTQTLLSDFGLNGSSNLMLICSLFFSILVALLLYISVEKPFMQLRYLTMQRQQRSVA